MPELKRRCIECGKDLIAEDFLLILNPLNEEFFKDVIFPKSFIKFRCLECQERLSKRYDELRKIALKRKDGDFHFLHYLDVEETKEYVNIADKLGKVRK